MDPRRRAKVSTKVVGAVAAVTVLSFGLLTWILQRGTDRALLAASTDVLEGIRTSRSRSIEQYFAQQRGSVLAVARALRTRTALAQLGQPGGSADSRSAARATLDVPAENWLASFGWEALYLLDLSGRVVYWSPSRSSAPVSLGATPVPGSPLAAAFEAAMLADRDSTRFVDFVPTSAFGQDAHISAPVFADSGGPRLGAFVVRISDRQLQEIMTDRTGLRRTGEAYIIGPESMMRTPSRFDSTAEGRLRRVGTEAARLALSGRSGTIRQLDYRGQDVLSSFAPLDVPGVQWAILAEIDFAEMRAPARALANRALLVAFLMSFAGAALLILVLRAVVLRPISKLAEAARAVEAGTLSTEVPVASEDEIGQLARGFNSMLRSVARQVDELRDLQRMRDNLTNMIVHDLRAPLMAIGGSLRLLDSGGAPPAGNDDRTLISRAQQSVSWMVEMIGSLLDVTRMEAGAMPLSKSECDLQEVVADAIAGLAGLSAGRTLTHDRAHGPVIVNCDRDVMRRVIANLVGNALKFTPRTGSVTVVARPADGAVLVEVSDTGYGIDERFLPRVFEKFTQMEARDERRMYSTGLGLTFCKLAVEAHGGTIGVESTLNQGSRFFFQIPT